MSTAVLVADDPVTDSLRAVATAMTSAANDFSDSQVEPEVQSDVPATRGLVSRYVYSAFYYTSYGVVFPTMFVAGFVPGMGPIARGIADGARAASEAARSRSGVL